MEYVMIQQGAQLNQAQRSGLPLRIPFKNVRGFTIIELLVAIAIIILLLSILIVAVNAATRTSQKTRTQFLMNTIQQGLVHFKAEIGYFPPVLGANYNSNPPIQDYRRLVDWRGGDYTPYNTDDITPPSPAPPPNNPNYKNAVQKYYSYTSIAEYLIGWASHREDGYGRVPNLGDPQGWNSETPAVGIRHPGPDRVWGADVGPVANRMKYGNANYGSVAAPYGFDKGRVYGPYFELKDERLMGAINGTDANGNPIIVFAGDVPAATFETLPK